MTMMIENDNLGTHLYIKEKYDKNVEIFDIS